MTNTPPRSNPQRRSVLTPRQPEPHPAAAIAAAAAAAAAGDTEPDDQTAPPPQTASPRRRRTTTASSTEPASTAPPGDAAHDDPPQPTPAQPRRRRPATTTDKPADSDPETVLVVRISTDLRDQTHAMRWRLGPGHTLARYVAQALRDFLEHGHLNNDGSWTYQDPAAGPARSGQVPAAGRGAGAGNTAPQLSVRVPRSLFQAVRAATFQLQVEYARQVSMAEYVAAALSAANSDPTRT